MIGKTISHYKVIKKLGEGGMGIVYKAEDTKLKRTVALKFLPPQLTGNQETKKRFIHEAQAASALQHNNICTIHDIDQTDDGQMFICMDYYEGETLKKKIEQGPFKIEEALDISIQIAQGLTKAHEHNIIHRDIKPANTLLTKDGVAKILDFGLAKLSGRTKVTVEGTTLGTVAYMSPEQTRVEQVDSRTDIWSLGVMLYEMVTGQTPFKGDYDQTVMYSILNEEPEPLTALRSGVSMELEQIVNKALSKNPDERYQHADEFLADLKRERKQTESQQRDKIFTGHIIRQKKKYLKTLIPIFGGLILVILFFLFQPFQIGIDSQQEIKPAENRLAIMYFENLTDPQDGDKLGEITTNLLITDLTESKYLNVVSSQRLYDILKLLGREGQKKINSDVATEVAMKAKCRWMLLGSILQAKPQIVITSQLVNVESGTAEASQRITGGVDEDIFTLVDKLTIEIKEDLSLPVASREEQDRPVADVTTHSAEAYRCYLEGIESLYKIYFKEAEQHFLKALEYDTSFAMAYLWLGYINEGPESERMMAKAEHYSNKISLKEKHFLKSLMTRRSGNYTEAIQELYKIIDRYPDEKMAYLALGIVYDRGLNQSQEAIHAYTKAIEIDPMYKIAYNLLSYIYNSIGNIEKSNWAINQYIAIAPDEANPYDTQGDLYALNGRLDKAIESYQKALKRKPDFYASLFKLGRMYLFQRDYTRADSCYKILSSSNAKGTRSRGRLCLAFIPLYQGKFEEALEILDAGIAADQMEQAEGRTHSDKHLQKAWIYTEKKNLNLALAEMKRCVEIYHKADPDDIVYRRHYYIQMLAENGDIEQALQVTKELKNDIELKEQTLMYVYLWATGCIEFAQDNTERALIHFEKAAEDEANFWLNYMHARTYLKIGRLGEAVSKFEKVLSKYSGPRESHAIWAVKAYYYLGLAYEKSGWTTKAAEMYEEFLDIWEKADPGIWEIDDAKARLELLKGTSYK